MNINKVIDTANLDLLSHSSTGGSYSFLMPLKFFENLEFQLYLPLIFYLFGRNNSRIYVICFFKSSNAFSSSSKAR